MPRYPRTIFVHLPFEMGFVRRIFLGIQAEALKTHGWDIFTDSAGAFTYFEKNRIRMEAVISFLPDEAGARRVKSFARVALNVSNRITPHPSTCSVINDDVEIGRMAARYFLAQGYQTLHFCSSMGTRFAQERWQGFCEIASEKNVRTKQADLLEFKPKRKGHPPEGAEFPLAIFAENDTMAMKLLRFCKGHGWKVPGDVALLGVDDDELLVASTSPPISSIRPAAGILGATATRLIVHKKALDGMLVRIPPEGVVSRLSTSMLAIDDPRLRAAITLLEEHFRGEIDYAAISRKAGLSRRLLQQKFRDDLGVSPGHWVEKRRVEEARRLLSGTNLSQEIIAERCGFGTLLNFWRAFRRIEKCAPGTYRERAVHPSVGLQT